MPPSAARIIGAIGDAAARWCDPDFPERVRVAGAIARRTGYSAPVVDHALDRLFSSITAPALGAVIAGELGPLEILDAPTPAGQRPRAWARPLGRVCVISSRTTVGVALVPAIFALCAKNDVLVKDREDRLVTAFFDTLREELEYFAHAAHARVWDAAAATEDLANFDAVVAFGRDETLTRIRAGLNADARFLGYGARASAGYVAREDCTARGLPDLYAGAARDLILYESEGCLSLHVLFVERGGETEPQDVARELGRAVESASVEFPLGQRDAGAAAAFGNARNMAAFRAAAGSGAVYSDEACSYAVLFDPPRTQPPAFLPRLLGVFPVAGPDDAAAYLRAHALPLEGFALSSARADLVALATSAGAVRIAHFGALQHPPLTGWHGGRSRIAEFVRWTQAEI